jgi:hypothetical protein
VDSFFAEGFSEEDPVFPADFFGFVAIDKRVTGVKFQGSF